MPSSPIHKSIGTLRELIFEEGLSQFELTQRDKIDSLRRELVSQNRVFEMHDFGAGSPGEQRTWAEMEIGVWVQRDVSDLVINSCRNSESGLWLTRMVGYLQPETCVELGSCVGLSAAYIGTTLDDNGRGLLHTIEADPTLQRIAASNLERLGIRSVLSHLGTFKSVLPSILTRQPVGFAFVDGHHTGRAVIENTETILAHCAATALVVLDDIHYSPSTTRAWEQLLRNPDVQTGFVVGAMGVLVVGQWAR